MACQLLTITPPGSALAALAVRSWHAPEWGYVPLIGGGLCQLALPRLLRFALEQQGGVASRASGLIVDTFRDVGSVALIVGAVLAGRDLLDRLTTRRLRARIVAARGTSPPRVRDLPLDAKQDRFLGKCWELPMCRPRDPALLPGLHPRQAAVLADRCRLYVLRAGALYGGPQPGRGPDVRGWAGSGMEAADRDAGTVSEDADAAAEAGAVYELHDLPPPPGAEYTAHCCRWSSRAWRASRQRCCRCSTGHTSPSRKRRTGSRRRYRMKQSAGSEVHPALRDWSGHLADAQLAEWILFACLGLVLVTYALHALEYAITRRGW